MLKAVLMVVFFAVSAAYFLGYRFEDVVPATVTPSARDTRTAPAINTDRARHTAANVGEALANSANRAKQVITAGTLSSRVKSALALDDTVDAAAINVATVGGMAVLSGKVRSEAERNKAVQIARETLGVTSVSDRLTVR